MMSENIQAKYGLKSPLPHKVVGLAAVVCAHQVDSSELVGIEVEVENAQISAEAGGLNKVWMVKGDGSLRNAGFEFVSKPIPASQAPQALEYLMTHRLDQGCCFSPRTSVHVHLNMQDFTSAQVLDYMLIYVVFERLFYKFVGKGRMKNIYCVPLADTDLLSALVEYGEQRGRGWSKYTGLNTLPLSNFGTLEWRHMHGTFDVKKLSVWVNIITKIKEYVKVTPTAAIRAEIAAMNDGYDFERLLYSVFGDHANDLRYESVLELNYLQAKQAIASVKTLSKIRSAVTKTGAYFKVRG